MAAAVLAPGAARSQDLPPIDLAAISRGEGGFAVRAEGQPGSQGSGVLVAAGDVNGDGLPDLIAGGSICDFTAVGCSSAPVYVVFGRRGGASIELADVEEGRGGFAIRGVAPGDLAGALIAGPGDVNGDDLDDVLIGAPASGAVHVVFGKPDGAAVELSEVREGRGGFTIRGTKPGELMQVAAAGDFNADGFADILVAAPFVVPGDRHGAGESYLILGKPGGAGVELAEVQAGRGGFAIRGIAGGDGFGWSITGAGDVDGDGLADLLIGAPWADPEARTDAGEAYVIRGSRETAAVELADIRAGRGGFAIRGTEYALVANRLAKAGDVNGDGLADLVIGSPNASPAAAAHVVFGKQGGAAIELADVDAGRGGFPIHGIALVAEIANASLAGAGDGNGDGLDDLLMGSGATVSFVVFGRTGGAAVELSEVQKGQGGFEIRGLGELHYVGRSVAGGGDLNGDGLADLLVDVGSSSNASPWVPGDGHVVFGKAGGAPVELADVAAGQGGFTVRGIRARNYSYPWVAVAGDVNGDGLADLLTGAGSRHPGINAILSGEVQVVFGKADGAPVELADARASQAGFAIRDIAGRELLGGFASAGDVNGDGLADLVLGAPEASPGGKVRTGESYVVLGRATGDRVDLAGVVAGRGGFAIRGAEAGDGSGWRVAGAGDVNGDGLADVVLGAPGASPPGRPVYGESYVVFGKQDGALVELTGVRAGQGGFAIRGAAGLDGTGSSVAGVGDMNGDGLADVVIGAFAASPRGRQQAGESYVVFGKQDGAAVELARVEEGQGGFAIRGFTGGSYSGAAVAGAGDVNGDGLPDVLVGEGWFRWDGAVYVVFGKASGTPVELAAIREGTGGFVIHASAGITGGGVGASISGAGDVNGDGLADVLVAEAGGNGDWLATGEAYLVFGKAGGAAVELLNLQTSGAGFRIRAAAPQGAMRGDRVGPTVAGGGDIDGDGLADDIVVASGLPDARYPGVSGAAYVIFGPREGGGARFRRGAVRGEERIDIADAIALLGHLFLGGSAPSCLDAADADDSGKLDLSDAIGILGHLFLGAGALPAPGPTTCGGDPTADELGCAAPPAACQPRG